ncbi:hypothetical protein BH18ACT9_BH18ACT9_02890 [soil metagenome]
MAAWNPGAGRGRRIGMRTRLAVLGTLSLAIAGCTSSGSSDDASCADLVEFAGTTCAGHGDLDRVPETSGRTSTGTRLGCDDGNGAAADERVEIEELRALTLDEGFLVNGQVYLPQDAEELPAAARAWFEVTTCEDHGAFEVSGTWLGVTSARETRFDGDLRPPYRVTLRVTQGPERYVDNRVTVRADEQTEPQLGPRDVKRSLWEGGDVVAQLYREDGRFVAAELSTPG